MRNPPRRVPRTTMALLLVPLTALAAVALVLAPAAAMPAAAHATRATRAATEYAPQQRLGFQAGDDWESALAADRFGHLYAMYKHYDVPGGGTCAHCDLHLLVQRSSDGGHTWTAPVALAPVAVNGGQYDSQIAVDPVDGRTVWASFLQNTNSRIAVVESTDFGATWSPMRVVSDRPPGLDKDSLAVRGQTIAVSYDDKFNTWVSVSHDGGAHWATHLIFPGSDRFNVPLSAGGGIDSLGNIYFSWDSFDKAHSQNGDGPVTLWVTKSRDGGVNWSRTIIDVSGAPPPCANCGFAYLSAQMALRVGADDTIYLIWNGTPTLANFGPERIFFARSTDRGATYTSRQEVSDAPQGVEHCFPALATGSSAGDVRIGWMDTRTGRWNLFARASANGGQSWSGVERVSSYVPGFSYLTPSGYELPYGDYFQMVVDRAGVTQLVWGESSSYAGPGNIWTSHALAA